MMGDVKTLVRNNPGPSMIGVAVLGFVVAWECMPTRDYPPPRTETGSDRRLLAILAAVWVVLLVAPIPVHPLIHAGLMAGMAIQGYRVLWRESKRFVQ